MAGESLGELFVKLSLKADGFDKGLESAGGKLGKFSKNLGSAGKTLTKFGTTAIVGAGAGMVAFASHLGNTADKLLDLEQVTGLSTETLQEFKHVSSVAGVDFESFVGTISKFESKIPMIQNGTGEAAKAFEQLGVSMYDSSGHIKDMDLLFPEMLTALQGIENPVERNALAMQLFGRSIDDLAPVLALGVDGMKEAQEEAHKLGMVQSHGALEGANDFRIEMEKLKNEFSAFATTAGMELLPVLKDDLLPVIRDDLMPFLRDTLIPAVSKGIKVFADLPGPIKKGMLAFALLAAAIGPVLMVIAPIIGGFASIVTAVGAAGGVTAILGGLATFISATLLPALGALFWPLAIIAGAYLLFKNWDKIKEYVSKAFTKVKQILAGIDFKAAGLRIIKGLGTGLMNTALAPYKIMFDIADKLVKSVTGISLYDAGRHLMDTFTAGIKSLVMAPYNTVESALSKIDRLMPHSPAKEGPFQRLPNWNAVFDGIEDVDAQGMAKKAVSGMSAQLPGSAASVAANAGGNTYGGDSYEIKIGTVQNQQDVDYLMAEIDRRNKAKRQRRGITA